MNELLLKSTSLILLGFLSSVSAETTEDKVKAKATIEGIELPLGYKDWRIISTSHRTDHGSMRVIVGNDTAIEAARNGQTKPWPNGAILGKLVWKEAAEKHWPTAIAPSEFIHAEFMIKDDKKYASNTTGWGWGRWLGLEQVPYGDESDVSQSCISCHTLVKSDDWVFTIPVELP